MVASDAYYRRISYVQNSKCGCLAHQDEFKQGALVHLHEVGIPCLDLLFRLRPWLVAVLRVLRVKRAVLYDLSQDFPRNVGKRYTLSAGLCTTSSVLVK